MSSSVTERLETAELMLRRLEIELAEIRQLASSPEPEPELVVPAPAPPRQPVPPLVFRELQPMRVPQFRLPEISAADLLGPRAMAWAGGIVTALGIVFFFALAVNRGWIGAEARLSLGGIASLLVTAAGVWLRRRFGETHSSFAAVGAGIAGAYATVAFAAVRYDLIPDAAGLIAAAAVAAFAIAVSLAWSAPMLAALGLVGAAVTPVFLAIDSGLTTTGVAFVEIVLAAAAAVAAARRWRGVLLASALAAVPQVGVAVAFGESDWKLVVAAAALSAILLGAGLIWQLLGGEDGLDRFAAAFVLGGAVFGALAAPALFEGPSDRGLALLTVAVVYAGLAAGFLRVERDLSSFLAAIALAVGAISAAALLSDQTLAMTLAAEAAVLGWLAQLVREPRYRLGALAYLGLALGHTFFVDAPARDLFEEVAHAAAGVPSVLVCAGAALALAYLARTTERTVAEGLAWLAGALGTYAGSLGLVALVDSFAWGHVSVTGLWVSVAFGLVCAGIVFEARTIRDGGLVVLGLAMAKVLFFDLPRLDGDARYWSLLVVGAAVLLIGFLLQRARGRTVIDIVAAISIPVSAAFLVAGVTALVDGRWAGIDLEGAALLGIAAVYALPAAVFFRPEALRDLSTLYWATTIALVVPAAGELLSGTWLVLAWSAGAATLALLGRAVFESRLQIGAAAYLALALGHVFLFEAPPKRLFVAAPDPGAGVPALLLVVAAGAVIAAALRRESARDEFWPALLGGLGILATYTVSLSLLEVFQHVGAASVDTNFQRGHTAVSALWGLLGLALLYLGLTRRTGFRIAGVALFGVSLVKLFLFDLAFLSSVARALSFLAVGALLLLGGFFYQRLTAEEDPSPLGC